jgi:Family of unknown function (DUF6390)
MTALTMGQELFGRYAYPPNELGYCGPPDGGGVSGLASHANEFDGAWPYLVAIAEAIGVPAALDEDVVNAYWVGGSALHRVDPAKLLTRLRGVFKGQVTGLLDAVPATVDVLAHHSFHVFVVYPWVRFLGRNPETALRVLQDCRIRWGTVESVDGERVMLSSRPLELEDGVLRLGTPQSATAQWRKGDLSLAPDPIPGSIVSAHWDWVCSTLTENQCEALANATQATLNLVNSLVEQGVST